MIGDAHHRTIEYVGGNSARLPIARSIHAGENAPQAFENELIHEAAAVVADINDQAFFANLREKLFNECIEATVTHIGQVDVSHPPIRGSLDFFTIAFYPVQFADIGFIGDRLHLHCMRAVFRSFGIYRQCDSLVRGVHKQFVWILRDSQCPAVHCDQVVTFFHVHAWLSKR